jgi:rhodanese-related sulfurtransferase
MAEATNSTDAEEARRLIASGEAKALDLRPGEEWQESHLPGALHIPGPELGSRIEELSEHKRLIVVGPGEDVERAIEELRDHGHEAAALEGGMKQRIRRSGLPSPSANRPRPRCDRPRRRRVSASMTLAGGCCAASAAPSSAAPAPASGRCEARVAGCRRSANRLSASRLGNPARGLCESRGPG